MASPANASNWDVFRARPGHRNSTYSRCSGAPCTSVSRRMQQRSQLVMSVGHMAFLALDMASCWGGHGLAGVVDEQSNTWEKLCVLSAAAATATQPPVYPGRYVALPGARLKVRKERQGSRQQPRAVGVHVEVNRTWVLSSIGISLVGCQKHPKHPWKRGNGETGKRGDWLRLRQRGPGVFVCVVRI